jgi:putative phage-type endonuclease
MFNDYIQDIIECANDYYNHISQSDDCFTIAEYVSDMLKMVVDKKKHKYIYPEIIEQVISTHIPELNDNYNFDIDTSTQLHLNNVVVQLKANPQAPQRSPEWFAMRKTSIGASEIATIFNKNPFMKRVDLLLKKLDYKDPNKPTRVSMHCIHGIKYEEIATLCYSKYNNTVVNEFGSIKDKHIGCIAASPDGITDAGVMVEIKCPFTREIFGAPGVNYWHQMQQQLHVCELLKCDFLECKIIEYNWNEFKQDKLNHITEFEIGIIIEYINTSDDADAFTRNGWIYAPLNLSLNEYITWIAEEREKMSIDENKEFSRIIPWKLMIYSILEIYKKQDWWDKYGLEILKFWDELEILKIKGFDSIIPKKKERKRKPAQMMFVNDP